MHRQFCVAEGVGDDHRRRPEPVHRLGLRVGVAHGADLQRDGDDQVVAQWLLGRDEPAVGGEVAVGFAQPRGPFVVVDQRHATGDIGPRHPYQAVVGRDGAEHLAPTRQQEVHLVR